MIRRSLLLILALGLGLALKTTNGATTSRKELPEAVPIVPPDLNEVVSDVKDTPEGTFGSPFLGGTVVGDVSEDGAYGTVSVSAGGSVAQDDIGVAASGGGRGVAGGIISPEGVMACNYGTATGQAALNTQPLTASAQVVGSGQFAISNIPSLGALPIFIPGVRVCNPGMEDDVAAGSANKDDDAAPSAVPALPGSPTAPESPEDPALPALAEVPTVPEVPTDQEVPTVPGLLTVPEVPTVPGLLTVPEVPTVAGLLTVPEVLTVPGVPDPTVPEVPTVPGVPDPTVPEVPGADNPGLPQVPEPPALPEAPTLTLPGLLGLPTISQLVYSLSASQNTVTQTEESPNPVPAYPPTITLPYDDGLPPFMGLFIPLGGAIADISHAMSSPTGLFSLFSPISLPSFFSNSDVNLESKDVLEAEAELEQDGMLYSLIRPLTPSAIGSNIQAFFRPLTQITASGQGSITFTGGFNYDGLPSGSSEAPVISKSAFPALPPLPVLTNRQTLPALPGFETHKSVPESIPNPLNCLGDLDTCIKLCGKAGKTGGTLTAESCCSCSCPVPEKLPRSMCSAGTSDACNRFCTTNRHYQYSAGTCSKENTCECACNIAEPCFGEVPYFLYRAALMEKRKRQHK